MNSQTVSVDKFVNWHHVEIKELVIIIFTEFFFYKMITSQSNPQLLINHPGHY